MSETDKQSIRADEYEETVKYAPDWPPKPKQSVDPSVHATLDSITDHGPTKAQYITQIKEALQKVHDPEITIDIYNLGLIYDVTVDKDNKVYVKMTLTSPNCPVAESLPNEVKNSIKEIKEVTEVDIDLVWDPPWDKSMMSEAAKLELNL